MMEEEKDSKKEHEKKEEHGNKEAHESKEHHETYKPHHSVKKPKQDNMWKVVSGILAILLIISIFTGNFSGQTKSNDNKISKEDASRKALTFINENLLSEGQSAQVKDVGESNGLYVMTLNIDGKEFDSYVTQDGNLLFPSAVELSGAAPSTETNTQTQTPQTPASTSTSGTFDVHDDEEICTEDGKPVVYLFSTTWCPHCKWIKDTFDSTVKEYVDAGKIVAYHWQIDVNDNTLTDEVETEVPAEHMAVYNKYNPRGSIPTFVFGCKYSRIGNGYESQGTPGIAKEKAEFKQLIDELTASN